MMFAQNVRGKCACMVAVVSMLAAASSARALDQWASSVINYSTQYDTPDFSAEQALGAPNTNEYGDFETAWAPLNRNGTTEYITLGYTTPVYATGVVVRETYGNGFVTQIDLIDTNNTQHIIWSETDTSQPGSPVNFEISFAETAYRVKGVKVTVDTDHNADTWEEIDAVQLRGNTTVGGVGCGAGAGLALVALLPMALMRRRR